MRRPIVLFSLVFVILIWIGTYIFPVFWVKDYLPKGQVFVWGKISNREYKLQSEERVLVLTLKNAHLISEAILNSNSIQVLNSTHKVIYLENLIANQDEMVEILPGDILVYMDENTPIDSLKIGENVLVEGSASNFKQATNHGEFDMKKYYQIIGIVGSLREASLVCFDTNYDTLREQICSFREYCGMLFDVYLSKADAAVMKSILLGIKGDLTDEIKDVYKRSGIIHILAISGLHISLIGGSLYKFLRKIYIPIPVAAVCGMGVVYIFCMMSGMGVSTARAMIMYLLQMIASILGRTYDQLTGVCIAAILILIEQPLYIYHSGFLLSFGAVLSIAIVLPIFQVSYKALEGMGVSCAIFLGTLPIQLSIYYQITPLSSLLNLVIIPCMAFLMLCGLVYLVLGSIVLPMAIYPSYLIHFILNWFELSSSFTLKISGQTWIIGKPFWWQIVIYYLLLGFARIAFEIGKRKREMIKSSPSDNSSRSNSQREKFQRNWTMGSLLLLLLALVIILRKTYTSPCIHMIDVGQGDCFFITDGRGRNVLIDGGSSTKKKVGEYQMEPCLKYYGVSKLDCVFLSHLDEDHYNGVVELIERTDEGGVKIERICITEAIKQSGGEDFDALKTLCNMHRIEIVTIRKGDVWQIGDLVMECIYPDGAYVGTKEDTNENSMVLLLQISERKHAKIMFNGTKQSNKTGTNRNKIYGIFTGDLEGGGERVVEQTLLDRLGRNMNIPILKLAHHGSKNSSSESFLKAVKPQIALISAGRGNRYKHPHEETLERLEKENIREYRTDESGEISIKLRSEGFYIDCYLKE